MNELAVQGQSEPKLDAYRRVRHALVGFETEGVGEDGKAVVRQVRPPAVGSFSNLIPETYLGDVIAELENALIPALYDQAKELALQIMGRYAKRDLYDVKAYLFEMTRAFGEAPADLGRKAADELRTSRFLPNVGDLKAVLDPLVAERRQALFRAREHLAEWERRRVLNIPAKVVTPDEIDAIFKKFGHVPRAGRAPPSVPVGEPREHKAMKAWKTEFSRAYNETGNEREAGRAAAKARAAAMYDKPKAKAKPGADTKTEADRQ